MNYIKIKNWETHQHYKDRNPPWIKLQNALLTDYEFSLLSDASKLQLMLLWLLASQMDNKIPADEDWIKSNIKCKAKVNLKPLKDLGFIELYQDASGCVQDACLETEGEAEKETKKRRADSRRKYSEGFECFWAEYPKKQGKGAACDSWIKMGCDEDCEKIVEAVKAQCETIFMGKEVQYIPLASTWLNQERWNDDTAIEPQGKTPIKKKTKPEVMFNNAYREIVDNHQYVPEHERERWWEKVWDNYKDCGKVNGWHVVSYAKKQIAEGNE